MRSSICFIFILACSSCATTGAPRWSPDVSYFDGFIEVKQEPDMLALRDRIVALYASVHARDWSSVYEFRIGYFRAAVEKETFVRSMTSEPLRFDGYEVLACGFYKEAPQGLKVRLIMKFQQGRQTTYDVVWWRLENGVWTVENLGLKGLSLGEALVDETLGMNPEPRRYIQRGQSSVLSALSSARLI